VTLLSIRENPFPYMRQENVSVDDPACCRKAGHSFRMFLAGGQGTLVARILEKDSMNSRIGDKSRLAP
jgi:hypothetical protein